MYCVCSVDCVCVCVCVCDVSMRRQYVPLSLLSLQRLIDLGRIDVMRPIDLTAICNTNVVVVRPTQNHYGVNLTDEVRREHDENASVVETDPHDNDICSFDTSDSSQSLSVVCSVTSDV